METPTQANRSCGRITGEIHCKGEGLLTRWMKSQSACQMRTCTSRNLHAALKAKRFPNDTREKPLLLVLGARPLAPASVDLEKACSRACFLWGPEVYKQTLTGWEVGIYPFPKAFLIGWEGEGLQHLELELNHGQLRKKGTSGKEISATLFFPPSTSRTFNSV